MFDQDLESHISELLRIWQDEGKSPHPDPEMRAQNLPLHPEYLYRLSGVWQGWNAFLGVSPDDDDYAENTYIDSIEDLAFARMFHSMTAITGIMDFSRTINCCLSAAEVLAFIAPVAPDVLTNTNEYRGIWEGYWAHWNDMDKQRLINHESIELVEAASERVGTPGSMVVRFQVITAWKD